MRPRLAGSVIYVPVLIRVPEDFLQVLPDGPPSLVVGLVLVLGDITGWSYRGKLERRLIELRQELMSAGHQLPAIQLSTLLHKPTVAFRRLSKRHGFGTGQGG